MEDRDAILALMGEYCDSIDRGDLAGCAELFADGAWGIEGDLAQGSDAVKAVLDNVTLYDGRPMTRHLTSNVQITVDEDSAKAQSCITVMQGLPDFPLQAIFIGTYFDRFERRGDEWVWRERRIQPDLVGDLSRHRSDMAAD
ncbi:MAG: nuclear transport factor 2 family protein [Pseudomonadota bacterium]